MLTVYKFGPAWGMPDLSPFVVKLETYLRLAGIPYETKLADPRKAPKKKIPYITDDGVVLGDTRFIIEHLETKRGVSLDARLTPRERAVAAAFQSMLEEHLYFVMVHERWQLDPSWARLAPVLQKILAGVGVPGPMTAIVGSLARKQMLKTLAVQGTGRHSPAEVGRIGERLVGALAEQLGEGPFFFGAEPATIDATAYAFASGLLEAPFEGPVRDAALRKPSLKAYVDRIKQRYWAP
jgi:glutathione S-transferase